MPPEHTPLVLSDSQGGFLVTAPGSGTQDRQKLSRKTALPVAALAKNRASTSQHGPSSVCRSQRTGRVGGFVSMESRIAGWFGAALDHHNAERVTSRRESPCRQIWGGLGWKVWMAWRPSLAVRPDNIAAPALFGSLKVSSPGFNLIACEHALDVALGIAPSPGTAVVIEGSLSKRFSASRSLLVASAG